MPRSRPARLFAACVLLWGTAVLADEVQKRLVQAQQLFFLGRYEQALAHIENVVPGNEDQWRMRENLQSEIFRAQKNYAALEHLIVAALQRRPDRPDRNRWRFWHAELYLKADRIDSAHALLDSLWRSDPTDTTIAKVTLLYEQHTLSDWAQATYLDARAESGDTTRFAFELAVLYEARRDYARATAEYFTAIRRDSTRVRDVENRILQLLGTDEDRSLIEAELIRAAATGPGAIPARRLLITLYLETGRPDRAWQAAWEVDTLTAQAGVSLVAFIRRAAERSYYAVAAEAAGRVIETYPGSPVRGQVEWELAALAGRSGDYEQAAQRYLQIARESPVARFRVEAALAYADLRARHFGELNLADSIYKSVIATEGTGPYAGVALLGHAQIATMHGELDSARASLRRLEGTTQPEEIRIELTYRLAELSFFEGDLTGALETWQALCSDYPRSVWVNDALRHVLLITAYREAAEGDLKAVGRAEALARRRQYDSALTLLAGLRTSPDAPLAPHATLRAAQVHMNAGRADSAVAVWDQFVALYPDDADADLALVLAARASERKSSGPEQAAGRYRQLLESYPRSHWSEEARRKLRVLGQF